MSTELAPVDTLTDEEFDAAFEKMEQMELADNNNENTEPEQTEDLDTTDTGSKEDEVEQPIDGSETDEDNDDDQDTSDVDDDIQDDSTQEDGNTDNSEDETPEVAEYDFSDIPMDQELPFDISANGMQTRATLNQLVTGFQKGLNYTKHMQQLKPFRTSVGIMEDNDLTENDLNLLVEAKSGNKEAIAKLLADADIDPYDIETENSGEYIPPNHGKEQSDPEMEDAKAIIANDKEYLESTQNALNTMPQDFYDVVSSSANNMLNLHKDIKEGIYDKVMPEVMKLQALYGVQDTMKLYVDTARNMFGGEEAPKAKEPVTPKTKVNKSKVKSTTSKKGSSKPSIAKNLDDMDDDEFDKEFARLYGSVGED